MDAAGMAVAVAVAVAVLGSVMSQRLAWKTKR